MARTRPLAIILALQCLVSAHADTNLQATFQIVSSEFSIGQADLTDASIKLSATGEPYVLLTFSDAGLKKLNSHISEGKNSSLNLVIGKQALLKSVPIKAASMPKEIRVAVANIEEAYLLLKSMQ